MRTRFHRRLVFITTFTSGLIACDPLEPTTFGYFSSLGALQANLGALAATQ